MLFQQHCQLSANQKQPSIFKISQMHHAGQFSAASGVGTMRDKDMQGLMEEWQVLGLSLMMLSRINKDFFDIVKQTFGYIWDGIDWIKEVS